MQPYAFSYNGQIWRMIPAADATTLGFEVRDHEAHQAGFHSLKLHPPERLAGPVLGPEAWWCGLENTTHGLLLVHTYEGAGMPIHRGIYAYSQHDGRPCWQAPDLRYAGATAEGIYAVPPNATKAEGKLLDPATGQVLREEAVDGAAIDRWQNQQYAPLHFPDMVNEQTGDLAGYAQLVARTTGHQPYGQIEHWSWGEEPVLQALSYYIQREDNKLDNRIAVLYNGQLAYDELMLSAADGFGIDTFFLYHQTLIYVHEQQTLHLLPLNA